MEACRVHLITARGGEEVVQRVVWDSHPERTVCEVVKALILDFKLKRIGDFAGVVKDVDVRHVDCGHVVKIVNESVQRRVLSQDLEEYNLKLRV